MWKVWSLDLQCSAAPSLSEREKEGEAAEQRYAVDVEGMEFGFAMQRRSHSFGEGEGG
ncbi:MAG: hypothetical protein ABI675_17715 [Chitinophagaceae bacterium]